MAAGEKVVLIRSDVDIVEARQAARGMAEDLGFSGSDLVMIATAVSEIARNIVEYAKNGEIVLTPVQNTRAVGLRVIGRDSGPGIPDVVLALQEGYSTARGLGMGLPGARRLMDEFEIDSRVGHGTTVTMKKWLKKWLR
jgi:serine/threonine-protein kinase RsbT